MIQMARLAPARSDDRTLVVEKNATSLLQRVRRHRLYATFTATDREFGLSEASPLIVAVSGGGDSVALGLIAAVWAKTYRKRVIFAYFDHGTDRPRNRAEWRLVTELSRVLSVPSVRGSTDQYHDVIGRGSEETWRKQRYRFLRSLAGANGIVLTGHTMDDAAETFLLAAIRGGSGGALCGIRPQRKDGVVRPFLGVRREQLRDLLRELGVEWIDDPTNDDQTAPRAFIRQRTLPELVSRFGHSSLEGFARSARWYEELNDLVGGLAEHAASQTARSGQANERRLDLPQLRGYHPAIQRRVLREVLAERLHDPCSRLTRSVDQLIQRIADGRSFAQELPEGLRAITRQNTLVIGKPTACSTQRMGGTVFIPVPGWVWMESLHQGIAASLIWCGSSRTFASLSFDLHTAVLDKGAISGALRIRWRQPGERFRPLGAFAGRVRLKKYLRDRGVPNEDRWHVPIVTDSSGQLLWIPGVARSNVAALARNTRHAILLRSIREWRVGSNLGG